MNEEAGRRFLTDRGFPLYAALDVALLPAWAGDALVAAGIALEAWRRLVLIGNGGRTFWPPFVAAQREANDPIDHYSRAVVTQFAATYLDGSVLRWLYPLEEVLLPLQRLGELAGWSHPSPLGLGLHPVYGPWFAYRAAFLTTAPLTPMRDAPSAPPCDSCEEKPCLSACPPGAVRGIGRFDVPACGAYRLNGDSSCADRCLARLACPVGADQRYPEEQLRYHYLHSLETLRRYARRSATAGPDSPP